MLRAIPDIFIYYSHESVSLLISRKLAKTFLDFEDPDFYDWETHIFFDDCMEPDNSGNELQVSSDGLFLSRFRYSEAIMTFTCIFRHLLASMIL